MVCIFATQKYQTPESGDRDAAAAAVSRVFAYLTVDYTIIP